MHRGVIGSKYFIEPQIPALRHYCYSPTRQRHNFTETASRLRVTENSWNSARNHVILTSQAHVYKCKYHKIAPTLRNTNGEQKIYSTLHTNT